MANDTVLLMPNLGFQTALKANRMSVFTLRFFIALDYFATEMALS
jgi:hypothetical protein